MRFLIVSAVLACASAAPSHLFGPVAYAGLPVTVPVPAIHPVPALTAVAYTAAVPTISPGDVQAAAIDAQVKIQDLAIAETDKARSLLEQNSEVVVEKVSTDTDQIKENTEEAFWAAQDKQWQALDALKTAEAQIDGAAASNSPILAKSVVAGVAPIGVVAPIYTPGVVAPVVKAVEIEAKEAKPEEKKEEKVEEEKKEEPAVKSAEPEKDSVAVEAGKENIEAKSQLAPVIAAPLAYSYPFVARASFAPYGLAYSAYPQLGFAPSFVKSVW